MQQFLQQQSLGKRIILGLIIFAGISFLLKMVFYKSPETPDQRIHKMVKEVNEKVPIVIDSLTTLDSVSIPGSSKVLYNYKLNAVAENIDTNALIELYREWNLDKLKNDPNATFFKENLIELQARYFDKNGKYVCFVAITPYDYLRD